MVVVMILPPALAGASSDKPIRPTRDSTTILLTFEIAVIRHTLSHFSPPSAPLDREMLRERRPTPIDPSGIAGGPAQAGLGQQRPEDRRHDAAVDIGAETRVHPVSPEHVFAPRPVGAKGFWCFDFQR